MELLLIGHLRLHPVTAVLTVPCSHFMPSHRCRARTPDALIRPAHLGLTAHLNNEIWTLSPKILSGSGSGLRDLGTLKLLKITYPSGTHTCMSPFKVSEKDFKTSAMCSCDGNFIF